jgi:hypothetical protein
MAAGGNGNGGGQNGTPPGQQKKLNPADPLSNRLVFFVDMTQPGVAVDLVSGLRSSTAKTPVHTPFGPAGRGFTFADAATTHLRFTSGPWTVAVYMHINTVLGNNEYCQLFSRYVYTNESNNEGWLLQVMAANDANKYCGFVEADNGSSFYLNVTATSHAVGRHVFASVSPRLEGTDGRHVVLNGTRDGENGANMNPASASVATTNNIISTTDKINLYWAAAWSRQLSQQDHSAIAANPWRFVIPAVNPVQESQSTWGAVATAAASAGGAAQALRMTTMQIGRPRGIRMRF